jgi:surface protein
MDLKKNVYNSTHSKLNKRVKKMKKIIVLNDATDVTEAVKTCILNNDLDVLQINYNCDYSSPSPFISMLTLKEIKFKIQLGENVQSLSTFFYNCESLKSVPLFDTKNVTEMRSIFAYCKDLKSVPQFNTKKVTNMGFMFYGCESLETVPLFDTQNVTDMGGMFEFCEALKSVPLFDTTNVTNMKYMFAFCESLKSVPLFDTQNCVNINGMFVSCPAGERPRVSLMKF